MNSLYSKTGFKVLSSFFIIVLLSLGVVACSGTTSEEEAVDDFSTDATFFTGQSGDEEYTGEAKPVVAGETRGFETASVMRNKRGSHGAVLLQDGRVFVVGGQGSGSQRGIIYTSAEVFDPVTGVWEMAGDMKEHRHDLCVALLPDGRVLVTGGRGNLNMAIPTSEIYDADAETWESTGELVTERDYMPCTSLNDGRVLITGGEGRDYQDLSSAEVYDPEKLLEGIVKSKRKKAPKKPAKKPKGKKGKKKK